MNFAMNGILADYQCMSLITPWLITIRQGEEAEAKPRGQRAEKRKCEREGACVSWQDQHNASESY